MMFGEIPGIGRILRLLPQKFTYESDGDPLPSSFEMSDRLARHNSHVDHVMTQFGNGVITQKDMLSGLSYGEIPFNRRRSRLDARFVNRLGISNCPNCAAPVNGLRCDYCGTVFMVPPMDVYEDEEVCPMCGTILDSDVLEGDDVRCVVYHRCHRCGWKPT